MAWKSEISKRILLSVVVAIPAAAVSYFVRKVLGVWGLLDPVAAILGGWLKMHVSSSQAEWTVAAVIAVVGYGIGLWFIWRHFGQSGWRAGIRDEVTSAREQRPAAVRDWKTPIEAIEAFGNQLMRAEIDRRKQEVDEIFRRGLMADVAMRKIRESYPAGMTPNVPPDVVADYEQWYAKLSAAGFEGDDAKEGLKQANQNLLIQIVQELAQGKLIAKGFRMPRDGLGETELPQSEWRSLELDSIAATASDHGTIIFTGVLIGKPEDR